jgi:hypothetical protein
MRPTTPNYNFARPAGPSPPPTPTAGTAFNVKSRRNGVHFTKSNLPGHNGTITPNGNGPNFFYTPSTRPDDLSPRTSSLDSFAGASDSSGSPPRSEADDDEIPTHESPRRKHTHTRIVGEGAANFVLEDFDSDDYESDDSELSIIHPSQYEDAESEKALSVQSFSPNEIPSRILHDFKNLNTQCGNGEEDGREAWLEMMRAEKRRKRRSSGSVQKRTLSQSIGSDTDDEDIQPVTFDANDAGSSARRLRRKVKGERISLIFDDPPPRIDEEDEGPESVEEVVEIQEEEDDDAMDLRELPYYQYIQQDMEVDTSEEE